MRQLARYALVFGLACAAPAVVLLGCASGDSSSSPAAGGTAAVGGKPSGGTGGTGTGGTGGTGTGGTNTGGTNTGGTGTGGWPGECSGNAEQPCYSGPTGTEGVGDCKAGKQVCQSGTWSACQDEVTPTDETCDNRDNDCDGTVDEDLGQTTCGNGACQVTVDNCVQGQDQTCVPKTGGTETCDGVDNNCDGQIDEGCSCQDGQTQDCYSGPPATKSVGLCKTGKQTCSGGAWGTCTGEVLPTAELCDALDNNCDGQTDEGNPESGQACNTGKQGACSGGTTACQNSTKVCLQTTQPSNEVCDGVDNNCNGSVDEGNPGSGTVCSTGKPGICSAGTTQCVSGGVQCVQNQQPATEACDGVDNNCNGTVDEGCNCVNGQSQNCYSGPAGTQGVGKCKGGTQTCSNGNWGTCNGQVLPSTEACNNIDDNCNGTTDEGNPGGGAACATGLPGICAAGTMTCQSGTLSCKQNQTAAPSDICGNSLDDNCNGQTDENCGGGSCSHDRCVTGTKLTAGCDSPKTCVASICAVDPYCCNTSWDSYCVSEVRTVCHSLTCAETGFPCSHPLCTSGTSLVNSCDSAYANCVSKICAVDSYCCNNSWDSICVGEVTSVCTAASGACASAGCNCN